MQKQESDLAARTKSFALQMIRLFSALPKTTEAQVLGKQVLRSGTSVGAIIPRRIALGRKRSLLRNAAIVCERLKKQRIGWICSWKLVWSRRNDFSRSVRSAAN